MTSQFSQQAEVLSAINKLDKWLQINGWAGYDPYDILDIAIIRNTIYSKNKFVQFLPARIVSGLIQFFPQTMRNLFFVKKQCNAKGMGLLAHGYLNLYEATQEAGYKEKAILLLDWLKDNHSNSYSGICWGYPFDWQSRVFIPRGTPSSVVSSVVGGAFWQAYQVLGNKEYLDVCESICRFFLSDLNVTTIDKDTICFSYTPVDNFQVHNANLFAAEFLIRIGSELNNQEFVECGLKAANFALLEQYPDGSLDYCGKAQNESPPNCNDHYHVGFEIRMLYKIWKTTNDYNFYTAAKKYYDYYLENLVHKGETATIPKMYPGSLYPIEVHACAEAIILNSLLQEDFQLGGELAGRFFSWVIDNMQKEDGSFRFMINQLFGTRINMNIPYIRWGQGWMLYALSCFLLVNQGISQNELIQN